MRGPWMLAEDGCDRATAYHMSNKLVRRGEAGEELFATYIDKDYRNIVAQVDPETGGVLARCAVGQGFDNHCGAALALTPDDTLHVMNGSHHRGFVYRASATPADPESWSLPEAAGCRPTYPSLTSALDGTLHLTHRYSPASQGRWGAMWCRKKTGEPWRHAWYLTEAQAVGYIYPTAGTVTAPDGTLHLVIEWYKTFRDGAAPAQSTLVSHYESPDGERWFHTDGREVTVYPIHATDADPIVFNGRAHLRPGNTAVLPDGRPCVAIYDHLGKNLLLAVRDADRTWRVTDLTDAIAERCPGTVVNGLPQVASDTHGELFLVVTCAESPDWCTPTGQVHVLRVSPDDGRVRAHEPVAKAEPDQPDWLPSIEKGVLARFTDTPYLSYSTGLRGETCINDAQCRVRLVQLG